MRYLPGSTRSSRKLLSMKALRYWLWQVLDLAKLAY
jgi:hypothetical protein